MTQRNLGGNEKLQSLDFFLLKKNIERLTYQSYFIRFSLIYYYSFLNYCFYWRNNLYTFLKLQKVQLISCTNTVLGRLLQGATHKTNLQRHSMG